MSRMQRRSSSIAVHLSIGGRQDLRRWIARLGMLVVALWVAGCDEGAPRSTLQISVLPGTLLPDPSKFATVVVTGTNDGLPLVDGDQIQLTADMGVVGDSNTALEGGDDTGVDALRTTLSVVGGEARTRFYPPSKAGTATLQASFTDTLGTKITAKVQVKIASPGVTRIKFSCDAKNIPALSTGASDLPVGCRAEAVDDTGATVRYARIRFLAEAGQVTAASDGADDPSAFLYQPLVGGRQPVDVAPEGGDSDGEPRWRDSQGIRHNPRDGLVTIIAYTEGSDGIQDTPYVDVDDDEAYGGKDLLIPEADSEYKSEDQFVWKAIRILWTGDAWKEQCSLQTESGDTALRRDQGRLLNLRLVDKNMNPVAAASGDVITWTGVGDGDSSDDLKFDNGIPGGNTLPLFSNVFGMDINPTTFKLANRFNRSAYLRDVDYTIRAVNKRPEDDERTGSLTYYVFGTLSRAGAASGGAAEETPRISLQLQ